MDEQKNLPVFFHTPEPQLIGYSRLENDQLTIQFSPEVAERLRKTGNPICVSLRFEPSLPKIKGENNA